MELIIKIPDKVYNRIKSDNGHGYCTLRDQDEHVIVNAICNSTPLPKGHGDLIDRSKILSKGKCCCRIEFCSGSCETCSDNCVEVMDIESAPTVTPADKEGDNETDN